MAEDLHGFKSKVSEQYVRTEDFEDLLEEVLRRGAGERSEEKRRIYREFIVNAIRSPGESYDEQLTMLTLIERLPAEHLQVMRALAQAPRNDDPGMMGSPVRTLERRTGFAADRIAEIVDELNGLRLTKMQSLHTMMTGRGAEDLRHALTRQGLAVLGLAN